ncbi:MAG: hypothetical protein KFF49_11025, partial [Bacteroidales bacterium]|nr:hypothetical protein [Bacteroidales bacterium]
MAEQKTENREAINRDMAVNDIKEKERQPDIVVNRADPILSSGSSMGIYLERKLTDRIFVRPGLAFALQSYKLDNSSAVRESDVYTAPAMVGASVAVENYD